MSIFLRDDGGAVVGGGGAGICGGAVLPVSSELLILIPLGSWWLFSRASGKVADLLASASLSADGATGGAGGAPLGRPALPLTDSDLKNSSRLLCNCK